MLGSWRKSTDASKPAYWGPMNGPAPGGERNVICGDAIAWLREQPVLEGCSVVTSLPDASELGMKRPDWTEWFVDAAALVMARCPDDGVALFFQSDVKKGGCWVDKSWLCHRAAERAGMELLLHKIVCRVPAGTVTFGRAGYSHLLAYSRGVRLDLSRASADVLPELGEMTWVRAMGVAACRVACDFVRAHTRSHTIVDPFCGVGTVLAVANEKGFRALGVELSRKRASQARQLVLSLP